MSYKEFGNQTRFKPTNTLPQDLEHKPLFAMPYQCFDGMYSNKTDARYLSVGLAQWGHDSLSLKIMRHTGEKWSRQSEELPLHRVFDSAIFLSKVLFDRETEIVEIERNTFEGQDSALQIKQENTSANEQQYFDDFIKENEELIKKRLNALYATLVNLKTKGKF